MVRLAHDVEWPGWCTANFWLASLSSVFLMKKSKRGKRGSRSGIPTSSRLISIRLAGIDAPELGKYGFKSQDGAREALQFVKSVMKSLEVHHDTEESSFKGVHLLTFYILIPSSPPGIRRVPGTGQV